MGILLSEHKSFLIKRIAAGESFTNIQNELLHVDDDSFALFNTLESKKFNHQSFSFSVIKEENHCEIKADYFVGIDWLGDTGRTIYVEPKINMGLSQYFRNCLNEEEDSTKTPEAFESKEKVEPKEINYLKILLDIMALPQTAQYSRDIIQIDWKAKPITIDQKNDRLTPFLIIQFLQHLKTIVRKGLKKSYYKIQENLNSKVKGKVLIGQHIKKNVFKNRLTSTFCEFQVFGEDHLENRFLKKVLEFAISYIGNNPILFSSNLTSIKNTFNYCRPAFEHIGTEINEHQLKNIKKNLFFNEYGEAIRIGQLILKRFSHNITKTMQEKIETPPFWIDMPKMFELYFYYQLVKANPEDEKYIHYQLKTYGNHLDFLITKPGFEMVIDTKYKLKYIKNHIHRDIRQVSGYARLKKVINTVKSKNPLWDEENMMDCLIIYPHLDENEESKKEANSSVLLNEFSFENIKKQFANKQNCIGAYHKVFKLGINLPII
ncbi:McrC family protein [Chryseobacterium rhizoplanae]|uniref:Restriction endonuclease n=1 Tax=Chryseobacterium bernardetii TaxID=1241978 RepID=A0A3G6TD13_9FLAO|nr:MULTISPECIES: restriction endonuclease [Chryseobacterium]AZB27138.1 restriction endonuclease [Chryseobacterium bernardetii]UCA61374.1 McrC family protein [Chryseobacterium rhizoplanae]